MMNVKIEASNDIVVAYLNQLWAKSNNNQEDENVEEKKEENNEANNNIVPLQEEKKEEFKKDIKTNLQALRDVGFRVYHNIGLEKEVNLNPKQVVEKDIEMVYNFKVNSYLTRKQLMTNIARCTVFPKYKSGNKDMPNNFRYLVNHHNTIKILDRLWVLDVINKCGQNIPDPDIFKTSLVKNFSPNIIDTATVNTMEINSVVLLDIARAFDSLEWDVLENLMLANLTRKTNAEIAQELVSQYIVILKNRELYYNDILISVSKGIPTGLPSSNLVFTLALEEIIYMWMNKNNYKNNREFILNVYVDDIYLKIINLIMTKEIVYGLIDILAEYKLYVNMDKSKGEYNLDLEKIPNCLKETDYYLGIPFTRNKKLYGELILKELQYKNNGIFKNISWNQIYDKLNDDKHDEQQSIIFGFMNYKLRPVMNTPDSSNKVILSKFIHDTYVNKNIFKRAADCIGNTLTSFFKSLF